MALHLIRENAEMEVVLLVSTINIEYRRVSMHGLREQLIVEQAASIGLPLHKMMVLNQPSNSSYEISLRETLRQLKREGIETVVFGDIFLEDLRAYRESLLAEEGLKAVFPLWGSNTKDLFQQFLNEGFQTRTCCIDSNLLAENFLNRDLDADFLNSLPVGIDPCGENGEYHTFCYNGPIFKEPIAFTDGERRFVPLHLKSTHSEKPLGFWYVDLIPA